jgi:hypothetical protein
LNCRPAKTAKRLLAEGNCQKCQKPPSMPPDP